MFVIFHVYIYLAVWPVSITSLQDSIGLSPLNVACINGHIGTAKVLIENGAIIDFIDKVSGIHDVDCMF